VKTSHQIEERRQQSIRTVAVLFVVFVLASLALPLGEQATGLDAGHELVTVDLVPDTIVRNVPAMMIAY
jgi:hypothetical protein